jgi:hypothetical protein
MRRNKGKLRKIDNTDDLWSNTPAEGDQKVTAQLAVLVQVMMLL